MRRASRYLVPLLLLLFAVSPARAEAPTLFDSYSYAAPKAAMEKLPGMRKGEDAFAEALLLDNVSFLNASWKARFDFTKDKLTRVSLMIPYTQELADAVENHLRGEGYEMLAILVGKRELDFIAMLKVGGIKGLEHGIAELHANGPHERMTRAWFMTRGISKKMKQLSKNLREFLNAAPSDTREAEVTILRPAKDGETPMLLVDFTFPILNAQM